MISRTTLIQLSHTCLLSLSLFITTPYSQAGLPDIGEPADRTLSPEEESKLGSSFYRAMQQQEAILNDPELSSYLQSLGNRLNSGINQDPFTFFIVKDGRINAFAVPGGFIGINAGLILATRNEGELASVIAHEIAHVTQRHIARYYAESGTAGWAQLGAFLAAVALSSQGEGDAAAAAFYAGTAAGYQSLINHTRLHEQEADRVGIQYLAQAGFNPADMAGFFDVMRNKSLEADKRFEILRTHPLSENRVAEARSRAQQIGILPVPSSKRYLLMKARLIALLGRQRELLKSYQKNHSNLIEIDRYTHALLLTESRQFKAAGRALNKLLEQGPDNIHYRLASAQLNIQQQRYAKAEQQLRALLALYPGHMGTTVHYAHTLRLLKKHPENIQLIKSVPANKRPVELYRLLAESLSKTGQPNRSQLAQGEYYFLTGRYRAAGLQFKAALREEDALPENEKKHIEQRLETIKEEQKK